MKRVLEILALGGAVLGSLTIASNIGYNFVGYVLFFVSSVASFVLVRDSNVSKSIYYQCLWFMCMNLIGMWRY